MGDNQVIKLNRKQLYDEIWEISVSGVAKKYNAPYSRVKKLCKDNNIPTPSTGYWTSLEFGKNVEKIALPESEFIDVALDISTKTRSTRVRVSVQHTADKNVTPKYERIIVGRQKLEDEPPENKVASGETIKVSEPLPEYKTVTGVYNVYKREILYEEVWTKPIIEVASSYGVSDVTILKTCKSFKIPVSPKGYWLMKKSKEKVEKALLPETDGPTQKTGPRSYVGVKPAPVTKDVLPFLSHDERVEVLDAAAQLTVTSESGLLHKKIVAYKSVVNEWNKSDKKTEFSQRNYSSCSNQPPFLAGVISRESLPRAYRLLDTLFREVERLGGSINDDLSLQMRNENVRIEIAEGQDGIKHEMTRQEAKSWIEYEDDKRRYSGAYEPKMRKYDYIFNGRFRISVLEGVFYRDTKNASIEAQLGEILIDLYEESEIIRLDRAEREEAARKRKEVARIAEEHKERYNEEIGRTVALQNEALDFEISSSIRLYIEAVRKISNQVGLDDETKKWIEWATQKADWFDPTVARTDEFFGKRQHEKSDKDKALSKRGYW